MEERCAMTDAALAYAARGWPVLPCRSKKPNLTPHGVDDATTDANVIRAWWTRWPDANVAIACGAPGPLVLDVDDLDGGRAVFDRLAVLDPPTVATARGRHLYFAGDDRPSRKLPFGELRGRGLYVVAPPSVHESGREYMWLAAPNGTLPVLPREPRPRRREPVPVEDWIAAVRGVPEGQRKHTLCRLAGHLLAKGVDPHLVRELAQLVNARNQPPLPARDVDRVVDWVAGAELRKRRGA
jgi:hypothetical protein